MSKVRNVYEYLERHGDDREFSPPAQAQPTAARPGSAEKIELLRQRVQDGQPLWHYDDLMLEWPPSFAETESGTAPDFLGLPARRPKHVPQEEY